MFHVKHHVETIAKIRHGARALPRLIPESRPLRRHCEGLIMEIDLITADMFYVKQLEFPGRSLNVIIHCGRIRADMFHVKQ
jgi:hypothetical protein